MPTQNRICPHKTEYAHEKPQIHPQKPRICRRKTAKTRKNANLPVEDYKNTKNSWIRKAQCRKCRSRSHFMNHKYAESANSGTANIGVWQSIILSPITQWWRITFKILRSGSWSSPKSDQFVLVTHPTWPPSFIRICPQLFEISCTQANKQTEKSENITSFHLRWWR